MSKIDNYYQRIIISTRANTRLFIKKPQYILLALLVAAISLGVVLWTFNLNLLWYIFFQSPLNALEKITFILSIYGGVFTNFTTIQAATLIIFSIFFGINISILVFVIKTRGQVAKNSQKSAFGLFFAVIASGCAACGSSIITPILLSLGATSTIALSSTIGMFISFISILVILYSIYSLGKIVAITPLNFSIPSKKV